MVLTNCKKKNKVSAENSRLENGIDEKFNSTDVRLNGIDESVSSMNERLII